MRKVVTHLFISLDGVVESPDWTYGYFNEEMAAEMQTQLDGIDAVLLGRVGYLEWADYWPTATDEPFATFINNTPKYVVSSTLDKVEWKNSSLLKGDLVEEITKLKQQPGKNIGVNASITLNQGLLALGLLDEINLSLHPVIVGKGKRLFQEGNPLQKMKLVESKTTSLGVVLLKYQPDRSA